MYPDITSEESERIILQANFPKNILTIETISTVAFSTKVVKDASHK